MTVTSSHAWYLFWLGLATGATVLAMTAYLTVSPRWLQGLLIASGAFVISRYVTMALFATAPQPEAWWGLRRCWLATSVGLTFPSVVALDQLVRHPAMSPKKLLMRFAPFLAAYSLVILFGHFTPMTDRVVGWAPRLTEGWRWFLAAIQGVFVIGFIALCLLVMRKIPSRHIRLALLGLVAAHSYLGFDGLLLACGGWYFRPFLFSELLTLLAIWFALQTARTTL